MMTYHFQVRTDTHVMLAEAVDFRNADEARVDAARRVGILLQEHAAKLWADENWQMDVTDGRGLVLFVIYVQAAKSAATASNPARR
jgi:hypothetical protein